jgi:hypothetical protein
MSDLNETNRNRRSGLDQTPADHRFVAISGALTALAMVVFAGCGAGSPTVVRSGAKASTTTVTAAPTTAPPSTSTSLPPSTATTRPKAQRVTITPSTGLKSSQTVSVVGTGFSPGEQLVVTECAANGTNTGPADCNLSGMQPVVADASGRVTVDFQVVKGPFGGDNVICNPSHGCLVSVTQATPSPTQEADAPISFAG